MSGSLLVGDNRQRSVPRGQRSECEHGLPMTVSDRKWESSKGWLGWEW